ncbi:MAG TPA: transcriptional repressor LexA [bacterium]|nr:transcriptional repressor LexA [Spirochaetota bacterium]HQN73737.1 transcriptional repressor LexA [bacterium]
MKNFSNEDLTVSQRRVLEAIRSHIEKNGFPPTSREIGKELGITPTSVFEQLDRLEKKGFIKRQKKAARSIEILDQRKDDNLTEEKVRLIKIPVLGTIAAGQPILADENFESEILVDESSIGKGKFFALKVKGDSMINAGINQGDLVIIRRQPVAENGEIVAALIDNEATIKRLKMDNGKVLLMPENDKYSPIEVTYREDFRILGKLITTVSY